jgi:hypothetical protein
MNPTRAPLTLWLSIAAGMVVRRRTCGTRYRRFARIVLVPARYIGTVPTRAESYVVAAIAFVVSTAFWATVGALLAAFVRMAARRSRAGTLNQNPEPRTLNP